MSGSTAVTAKVLKSTPERVAACITKLRAEGRKIGWYDGAVRGTSEVRACAGGEQKRIRALIILAAVDRRDKVPLNVVLRARQDLKLPELEVGRRGTLPKGADAIMTQAGPGDGTPLLERLVVGVERLAAAMERMEHHLSGLPRTSLTTPASSATQDGGATLQPGPAIPVTSPSATPGLPTRASAPTPPATISAPAQSDWAAATTAQPAASLEGSLPHQGSAESAPLPRAPADPAARGPGSLPPRPMPKPRKPSD